MSGSSKSSIQVCLGLMTNHNLSEHLSWLLGTKPFAILLAARSPQRSGTSRWAEEPDTPLASQTLEQRQSQFNSAIALGHGVGIESRNSEFARPALPARLLSGGEVDSMARLQSGPKSSTKPRLLSQVSPGVLNTPNTPNTGGSRAPGTSLKDRYAARYRQDGKSYMVFCGRDFVADYAL